MKSKPWKRWLPGWHQPRQQQRRLRLEPLESRTVLSATGSAVPSMIVESLLAGPWPGPMPAGNVGHAQPFQAAKASAIVEYADALKMGAAAVPPLRSALSTTSAVDAAAASFVLRLGPMPLDQASTSKLKLTAESPSSADQGTALLALAQNATGVNAIGVPTLSSAVLSSAKLDQIRNTVSQFRSEFLVQGPVPTYAGMQVNPDSEGSRLMLTVAPHWTQESTPEVRSATLRITTDPRAATASHLAAPLASSLLGTLAGDDGASKSAALTADHWQTVESLEKGGFVAFPAGDAIAALDLIGGGSAVVGHGSTAGAVPADATDAARTDTHLAFSLDEALRGFANPLAASSSYTSAGEDGSGEGGYVRIGSSSASRSSTASDRFAAIDYLWRDPDSDKEYPSSRTQQRPSAGSVANRAAEDLARRTRAAPSDDGGLIELTAAPGTYAVCALMAVGSPDAAVVARTIRMDEGLGLFQAFELATAEAEDSAGNSTAAVRGPAGISVSASSTDSPATAESAAADRDDVEPTARAAKAFGFVIASVFTIFQERRRKQAAQFEERPELNRRKVRIDRVS